MEDIVSPEIIQQAWGERQREEAEQFAAAARIFQEVERRKEDEHLPLTHRYLLQLARDPSTKPTDSLALGRLMTTYPQLEVEITVPLPGPSGGKIALPIREVTALLEKKIKVIREAGKGEELAAQAEKIRSKIESVLRKLGETARTQGDEGIDRLTFSALQQQQGNLAFQLLREEGEKFWWKTAIPNFSTGLELQQIARKQDPRISSQKARD